MTKRGSSSTLVLAALLILAACFAVSQTGGKKGAQKSTPPSAAPPKEPPAEPVEIFPQEPTFEMPDALPPPAPMPEGSPTVAAYALAKKVVTGGPDALPALMRAALESGFSIHDEGGNILHQAPQKSDIGLAVSDFDLAIAAYLTSIKDTTELSVFDEVYSDDPNLKDMQLREMVAENVFNYGGSAHSGLYFWSAFIQAMAMESDGAFEPIATKVDDAKIGGVQLLWLAYMAAGQAYAGHIKKVGTDPRLPSHGPNPAIQNQLASMRNSQIILTRISQSSISKYVEKSVASGTEPAAALLSLAYSQLLRTGLKLSGKLNSSPLVRTKVKGQEGGDRNLDLTLTLRIGAKARARYNLASTQLYGKVTNPLPPDGPFSQSGGLDMEYEGEYSHIANAPAWQQPVGPGKFRVQFRGDKQEEDYPANAPYMDRIEEGYVIAHYPGDKYFKKHGVGRKFEVPVRDWLMPGVHFYYRVSIKAKGTLPLDNGGSYSYRVIRSMDYDAQFSAHIPWAYIEGLNGAIPKDMDRFDTWRTMPGDKESFEDKVDDFFVSRTFQPGCGDGGFENMVAQCRERLVSVDEAKKIMGGQSKFQVDSKQKSFSANFLGDVSLPVKFSSNTGQPRDGEQRLFAGTELANPNPNLKLPQGIREWPSGNGAKKTYFGRDHYIINFATWGKFAQANDTEVKGYLAVSLPPNQGGKPEELAQVGLRRLLSKLFQQQPTPAQLLLDSAVNGSQAGQCPGAIQRYIR